MGVFLCLTACVEQPDPTQSPQITWTPQDSLVSTLPPEPQTQVDTLGGPELSALDLSKYLPQGKPLGFSKAGVAEKVPSSDGYLIARQRYAKGERLLTVLISDARGERPIPVLKDSLEMDLGSMILTKWYDPATDRQYQRTVYTDGSERRLSITLKGQRFKLLISLMGEGTDAEVDRVVQLVNLRALESIEVQEGK